jgi:hypothetical protein
VLWTRRPSALAFIGMPQAWLFQIVFAVVSPAIDLALLISIGGTILKINQHGWDQTQTDVLRMALYWAAFSAVDLACGWVAYRLDAREKRYPAFLLLAQRIVYRQLMYSVVIRAVDAALAGLGIGWGKLERTGRVTAPEVAPCGASSATSLARDADGRNEPASADSTAASGPVGEGKLSPMQLSHS